MTNKTITQEQAVKIAEWLGFRDAERCGHLFHEVHGPKKPDLFPAWLSSPEGEVAMMDKLEELGEDIFNEGALGDSRVVSIQVSGDGTGTSMLFGDSPTRNEALQLAILEMIEGRE